MRCSGTTQPPDHHAAASMEARALRAERAYDEVAANFRLLRRKRGRRAM